VDTLEQSIITELHYAEWIKKMQFSEHKILNIHLFDATTNCNSNIQYNEYRANQLGAGISFFSEFELKDKTEKTLNDLVVKPLI
jgi:hypothetical protein